MKTKCSTSWHSSRGMTLIEVLASLLLMGSILVALVGARGRLLTQHAEASDKRAAVHAADALLTAWWSGDPPSVPAAGRGDVATHAGWMWTTTEVGGAPDGIALRVVRLTITDERDLTRAQPRVLARVDVLVPRGREAAPRRHSAADPARQHDSPAGVRP